MTQSNNFSPPPPWAQFTPGAPAPVAAPVQQTPPWVQPAQPVYPAPLAPAYSGHPFSPNHDAILDGVATAQVFGSGAPFFPAGGNFVAEIEAMKTMISKNPKKLGHLLVIVDCKVLWSDVGIQPGAIHSQTIDLMQYGAADLQVLVTALYGGTPGNQQHVAALVQQGVFSKEKLREYTSPANPMRGKRLRLRTYMNKSNTFTKHAWAPMGPEAGTP